MRRGASARDNALDELVRMRDTLALREEQIKSERARVRELELQLQLREKEMEIERLKAMVASVGDGNGTTATLGANEYAQPRTTSDRLGPREREEFRGASSGEGETL